MEAWRRQLNDPVSAFPIAKAGPAHIATLKTFDPPLRELEGRRLRGTERRGKRLFFPTEDGELVLLVHLMTAGRLKFLQAGEKSPKTPAFALQFEGGSKLILTENAKKKTRGRLAAHARTSTRRGRAPRPGSARPQSATSSARSSRATRAASTRSSATSAPSRGSAARGRTRSCTPRSSPRTSSRPTSPTRRSRGWPTAINGELARGLELRERGASDERTYRVHRRLGEPCYVCGTPLAQVDFEEHTIFYCPECQTGGRVLKDRRLSRLLR